ncbi:hypothetical protein N7453_010032 [Penicillium expansum]|nr:hypothetical protein N7453_010032 [Penicillium expansum]
MEGYAPEILDSDTGHNQRQDEETEDLQTIRNYDDQWEGTIVPYLHQRFYLLRGLYDRLKGLQPEGYKGTMSEAFLDCYMRDQTGSYNVQVAEDIFEHREEDRHGMDICYRQLFLAVMRDFPSLTSLRPYQDSKKRKARPSGVPSERLINLAQLAVKLGFQNDEILALQTQAAESRYQIVTEEFLNQLQPPDRYHVDTETSLSIAQTVSERISNTSAIRASSAEVELTTDLENLPKKFRCSRPSYQRYLNDRQLLFLGNIYQQEVVPRSYATSFAIQRDIFLSFFGKIDPYSEAAEDALFASPDYPENSYHSHSYNTESQEDEGNTINTNGFQEHQDESQEESEHQDQDSSGDFESRLSESRESDDPLNQPPAHQSRADSWETHSISTQSNFWAVDDSLISIDPLMTPSDFLNDLISRTDDILLYFWQTRQYTQLSRRRQDEHLFESKTRELANQNQMFISISRTKPHLVLLKDLYATAVHEKLILVGPKHDRRGLSRRLMSQAQDIVFKFLDSVDLHEPIA